MGHIFDFKEALAYEKALKKPDTRRALSLELQLMREMLNPAAGDSLLDIGCGTGACMETFLELGLKVTGLDPSTYALDIALKKTGNRVDFYRGFAEDLPFDDNSFNHACLFTTLEFVDDPKKALAEAFRVAKDRVFLGVLNRYALKGVERRVKGIFNASIYNHARFFSVWELKHTIFGLIGQVPITWRTVCQLPSPSSRIAASLDQSRWLQRCPFGAFAGMVITLVPIFRTRPITARYPGAATG
jgi:SAM-dependent methyltransferase